MYFFLSSVGITQEMFVIFIHLFICFLLYTSFFLHLTGDRQCYYDGIMGTG